MRITKKAGITSSNSFDKHFLLSYSKIDYDIDGIIQNKETLNEMYGKIGYNTFKTFFNVEDKTEILNALQYEDQFCGNFLFGSHKYKTTKLFNSITLMRKRNHLFVLNERKCKINVCVGNSEEGKEVQHLLNVLC